MEECVILFINGEHHASALAPDYIGLHPKDNSIQYIKRIDEIMLVGIRIKGTGELSLRSSYPITKDTLNRYIQSNTCWKFK